jgi:hypothetical protein
VHTSHEAAQPEELINLKYTITLFCKDPVHNTHSFREELKQKLKQILEIHSVQ